MRLDELHAVITNSSLSDWHGIGCWGAMSGPSYLDKFAAFTSQDQHYLEHDSHGNLGIFTPNIDIRVAWGLYLDSRDPDYFTEPWTQNFSDTTAFAQHVDLLYRGSLVDRLVFVAVDGGRYKLPLPNRDTEDLGGMKTALMGYWVSPFEAQLGRIITGLEADYDVDDALRRAGIEIRESGDANGP